MEAPPSVRLHPTPGVVATGSSVELVCTSNNSCGDGIAWSKHNASVDSGGADGRSNVLTLRAVRAEDSGVYCCEAVWGGADCVNLQVEGKKALKLASRGLNGMWSHTEHAAYCLCPPRVSTGHISTR